MSIRVLPRSGTADPPAGDAEVAPSEIEQYFHIRQERKKLFPRALLVGLAAGAVAVAFRIALAAAHGLRNALVDWAHLFPGTGWLFPLVFGATGAAASVWLVRRHAPEAAGSGIPHIEGVLHRLRDLRPGRLIPVKFVGGLLALGSGLALGREGPSVQLGGAVGALAADRIGRGSRDRQTLIAAGAGAGLAAAFNAPLAGLIFILEEVQRDFRPLIFGATFIAAAVATAISQSVSGPFPVFEVASYPVPPVSLLAAFALVGVLCGGLGALFNRSLVGALDLVERVAPTTGRAVGLAALVGGALGLVAWFAPDIVGGGHDMSETVLDGDVVLAAIPFLFGLRFLFTVLSYGTGAPGGIFAPLLVLGALVGLAVGQGAVLLFPTSVAAPGAFAVVGMAGFFAAVVRAPLTGLVLIVEMTGSYALMLPLLVACFCAYLLAESLQTPPIYDALLERDLERRGITPAPTPVVVEYVVSPGAPFAGKAVRELGLPRGCVIVSLRDDTHEIIPQADTRLAPYFRVTAVIAPEADGAHERLRTGLAPATRHPAGPSPHSTVDLD